MSSLDANMTDADSAKRAGRTPSADEGLEEIRRSEARFGLAAAACILAVAIATLLPGIFSLALADVDESRCAMIVRDMKSDPDWLRPELDEAPYFEKPPLYFWLSGAVGRLGCPGPAAGRLVSALSALAVALLTYDLARRLWDRRTGLAAAVMFLTMVGTFVAGRAYRMDMFLALCVAFSLWSYVRLELEQDGPGPSRGWMWWALFYFGAALGTLAKGPIAVVLPGTVVFVHLVLMGRWRRIAGLFHPAGLAVYFAVAAPWFVFMTLNFPDYFQSYFIGENLNRLGDTAILHPKPLWYYVPVVLLGTFPWSGFLPLTIAGGFPLRLRRYREREWISFLWVWALVIVLLFTCAQTKFPQYVLPVWPALALLTAHVLVERRREPARRSLLTGVAVLTFAAVTGGVVAIAFLTPEYADVARRTAPLAPWVVVAMAAALVVVFLRHSTQALALILAGVMVVGGCFIGFFLDPAIHEALSFRSLGLVVAERASPDDLVCSESRRYSFAYYAGRDSAVIIRNDKDMDLVRRALAKGRHVWYAVSEDKADAVARAVAPAHLYVVARDRDHLLYSDRPLLPDVPSAVKAP